MNILSGLLSKNDCSLCLLLLGSYAWLISYTVKGKLVYFIHSIPGWSVIHGWSVRPGYTHMHDTDNFNEAPPLNA